VALVRLYQLHHDLHCDTFAATAIANNGQRFTSMNFDVQISQNFLAPKPTGNVSHLDGRIG
jgi:hypothetical protein